MKKLQEVLSKAIPPLWAFCWVVILTAGSFGVAVALVKWVLNLLGVL